jgi:homospermidine synthase
VLFPTRPAYEVAAAKTAAAGAAAVAAADAEAAKTPQKSAASPSDVANQFPGELAIDRRVRVFWPEEGDFFAGLVTAHNAKTGRHTIRYDDGDVEVEAGLHYSPRHRHVF